MKNSRLLFHPIFVLSLLLLILNDGFFKYQFHNELTGKLSDFVGLIVFSFFLAVLFPRYSRFSAGITAIVFIVWKSPLVDPAITMFNSLGIFEIARVVDYTDLLALLVLPFSQRIISASKISLPSTFLVKSASYVLIGCTVFAITATSRSMHFCQEPVPEGSIYIGKTYTLKGTEEEVKARMRKAGFSFEEKADSSACFYYVINYKQTRPFTVNYPNESFYSMERVDTIQFLNFNFAAKNKRKTTIELINIGLNNYHPKQNWKDLREETRNYERCLRTKLIKVLEEKAN